MTDKRNPTVKFCYALHVAHKQDLHMLTMNRILSQSSGLFKSVDLVYQVCWLIFMYIF